MGIIIPGVNNQVSLRSRGCENNWMKNSYGNVDKSLFEKSCYVKGNLFFCFSRTLVEKYYVDLIKN